MPSLCYANEGEAHWLGLQQLLGKTCAGRAEPKAFAPAFPRQAALRASSLAGDALVGGSCPYLSGKCLAITPRSRPPPALFLGTARFFLLFLFLSAKKLLHSRLPTPYPRPTVPGTRGGTEPGGGSLAAPVRIAARLLLLCSVCIIPITPLGKRSQPPFQPQLPAKRPLLLRVPPRLFCHLPQHCTPLQHSLLLAALLHPLLDVAHPLRKNG